MSIKQYNQYNQYNIFEKKEENLKYEDYPECTDSKPNHKTIDNPHFVNQLNKLPQDIINIVWSYVPKSTLAFLSKKLYLTNHTYIRPTICKKRYEEYIRTMVRRDNDFVFQTLLMENISRWNNFRNYYYHGAIYYIYLIFLRSYCSDFGSTKCKEILDKQLEELGLCKNQHKKKNVRYIRWIA